MKKVAIAGIVVLLELLLISISLGYRLAELDFEENDKTIILFYAIAGTICYTLATTYLLAKHLILFFQRKFFSETGVLKAFLIVYVLIATIVWTALMLRIGVANGLFLLFIISILYLFRLLPARGKNQTEMER